MSGPGRLSATGTRGNFTMPHSMASMSEKSLTVHIADFNGLNDPEARLEFYQHDQHWSNRMILGDSLYVMASLAEREHLRGLAQCIYIDPPYGVGFNSNWQVSTLSRDVKDGKREDISREPEQVKAFRDTWKDGIHSYLTYLRDRLTVARDLLHESGSIFVQIGDENVHRVRALMDEVFGVDAYVNDIVFKKKSATYITETVFDHIIWYCRNRGSLKTRELFEARSSPEEEDKFNTIVLEPMIFHNVSRASVTEIERLLTAGGKWARVNYPIVSQHPSETRSKSYKFRAREKSCGANKQWRFSLEEGLPRLEKAGRLFDGGGESLGGVVFWEDWNQVAQSNIWADIHGEKFPTYVVQTATKAVERCILMTTDPGDLVLDPTCGSGTVAFVAEQWGRRWITVDTSRVALALARARIMGAKYPFYYLADTPEGRGKEQQISGRIQTDAPTHGDIRQGFVYERVPHITLKSIADNSEIDVIWESFKAELEPIRAELNGALHESWEEWQIPREADDTWSDNVKGLHRVWWEKGITRQRQIDESIAKNADVERLYDRPYEDRSRIRVAGPFTVESLSPHRVMPGDDEDLVDAPEAAKGKRRRSKLVTPPTDFAEIVLEHLRTAGVQQSAKKDAIKFTSLQGWPGEYIGAEGRFIEGATERRAAIFFGPEFGTVSRIDLVAAAREATEARFDVLIACAFNFDAHASELSKLGPLPILKAKMNPDLHMAHELKNTGKGNLFVVFGEPDIDIKHEKDGRIRVRVKGVDVFDPNTGEIRSNDTEAIAAWFIDTDYDEQNFFVRHAYFLGAQDPYKSLKTALKAEVDADAWATLYSDTSRPFLRPDTGRIAVKVINHFGDEVMKVFSV
jgi:adenine-specific DNA-methyltransferase